MLLTDFRPKSGKELLEISISLQLSPEEQKRACAAQSLDVYFRNLLVHDASVLPLNYVLTRCEVAQQGDCAKAMWNIVAVARRKPGSARLPDDVQLGAIFK